MNRWQRHALPWLPPALLVTLATMHAALVARDHLSRWLGGGFGMFSTTDSATSRHVHIMTVADDGTRTEMPLPADLDEAMRHARVLPTRRAVDRFARIVAEHPAAGGRPVEVEIWQTSYDKVSMAPSSRLLRAGAAMAAAPRGAP